MSGVKIILASQSKTRQAMLKNTGLAFRAVPAHIDEESVVAKMKSPRSIASKLAECKALAVAAKYPKALVIGSDQVLECGGVVFSKAKNKADAVKKLKSLRGKNHNLISAVCVARGKKILWRHVDTANLKMRDYNDKLLKQYVAKAGNALTRSVGACEFEREGAWLLKRAEGDYFTILGMPLLPLLGYLNKKHGIAP